MGMNITGRSGIDDSLLAIATPAHVKFGLSKTEYKHIKTAAARRTRGPKEPCVLPSQVRMC